MHCFEFYKIAAIAWHTHGRPLHVSVLIFAKVETRFLAIEAISKMSQDGCISLIFQGHVPTQYSYKVGVGLAINYTHLEIH